MFKKLDCQLQNGVYNRRKNLFKKIAQLNFMLLNRGPYLPHCTFQSPTQHMCVTLQSTESLKKAFPRLRQLAPASRREITQPRKKSFVGDPVEMTQLWRRASMTSAAPALPPSLCIKLSSATLRYLIRSPTHQLSHTAAMRVSYL